MTNRTTQQPTQSSDVYFQAPALQQQDDEIDLRELLSAIWKGKWLIILVTCVFAAAGVAYALSQPNTYKADVVLASSNDGGKGGMAAMASQFGGLASLAGINMGGGSTDNKAMALAVLNSRQFINAFITKYQLLVPLMASEKWNQETGELQINPELYDSEKQVWIREVKANRSADPTDWEAFKQFKTLVAVAEAKDSGLVTLSITHLSPVIAQQWAELLVQELNAWMKNKSLNDTKRNIGYLNQQLEKTQVADMRSVFFQLIEEQTKNLMLAEVENEFAFQTIDPAVIPEEKAGPKRALICVLATLLGGMLGVAVVLIRFTFRKEKVNNLN